MTRPLYAIPGSTAAAATATPEATAPAPAAVPRTVAEVLASSQVQAVLGLAPSTVSKHLAILKIAGLVDDTRDGKWIEYELTDQSHNPHARSVLDLLHRTLDRDPAVIADRKRLREIKTIPLTELCALPAAKVPMPAMFIRMRAGPWAAVALSSAAVTLSVLVMSHWQATPLMSAATFSASAMFTSSTATLAPRRASSRAVASPRPDAPPVTSAACPWMFMRYVPSA